MFKDEADRISRAVTSAKVYIDHVGSTSVQGLASKPIIDILISLGDWSSIDDVILKMKALGYTVSEECHNVPRYFLTKYNADHSSGYHIHICEPHCQWGKDMLVFKNELDCDKKLSDEYSKLKKNLANDYGNDVQSYIIGKKNFIENRLQEVESEFGVNRLLSHQRAELNKAERLQIYMMTVQFIIAVIASFSVYLVNNKYLFALALVGFLFMVLWLYLSQGQQRHRTAGDQARRAILLISGLNMQPSAGQKLRINDGFNFILTKDNIRREEDHFASREVPSYKRLVEMIEESSYWTCYLQNVSSKVMLITLSLFFVVFILVSGAAIASLDSDNLISLSRAMIALVLFVISSDALGLLLSYRSAVLSIDEIFKRVETIAAKEFLESDTLLLMSDYNAAIERAPAILPGIYKLSRNTLNKKWRVYMNEKYNSNKK